MRDFLTFNHFITSDILIFFYYTGALGAPLFFYYFRKEILKYLDKIGIHIKADSKDKKIKTIVLVAAFICAEICWRMVFEAMIGYFDMHNYLYEILKNTR